jgi:uncharacterized integral membrane protein (TIGR00698 family)
MLAKLYVSAIAVVAGVGLLSSPYALLLGFIGAGFGLSPTHFNPAQWAKHLLGVAIVLLGFGVHLPSAMQVTGDALGLMVMSMLATLALALLLAKVMRMELTTAHLIGTGTAICGGSAIAAVGPAIRARSDQMALALAVVFILNSVALLVFPLIGRLLDLDQQTFGLWAAIAIHDTSSVVGAAEAFGDEALQIATTTKLARALWIIPLVLISAWWYERSAQQKKSVRVSVPWFIIGFVATAVIASYFNDTSSIFSSLFELGKRLLVFCLFLIGLSLTLKRVRAAGLKPMLLALTLWFFIATGSLLWLLNL